METYYRISTIIVDGVATWWQSILKYYYNITAHIQLTVHDLLFLTPEQYTNNLF